MQSLFLLFAASHFLSGLKALFYILLTSHLAEKVGVQEQKTEAKKKKEKFLPAQMEDLSEPAEPPVSACFSHHYQTRETEGKGRGGWRQSG